MIKSDICVEKKNDINYLLKDEKIIKYSVWKGDLVAFRYDKIMKNGVFPKLFNARISKHEEILKSIYSKFSGLSVLEIGTGTGNSSGLLSNDNQYFGVDISRRLMKRALKAFESAGFMKAELYICSGDNLPFEDNSFDVCICNLTLNFLSSTSDVLSEVKRVLQPNGKFICSVPLADRVPVGKKVNGIQFTMCGLEELFIGNGFIFSVLYEGNGALVYFEGINMKEE